MNMRDHPGSSGLRLRRRAVVTAPDGYSSSSSSDGGGGMAASRRMDAVGGPSSGLAGPSASAAMSLLATPPRSVTSSAMSEDGMAISPSSDGMDVDSPSLMGPPPSSAAPDAAPAPFELPGASPFPMPRAAGPSRGSSSGAPLAGEAPAPSVSAPLIASATPPDVAVPADGAVAPVMDGATLTPPARRRAPGPDHGHGALRRRHRRPLPPDTVSPWTIALAFFLLLIPPAFGVMSVVAPKVVRRFLSTHPPVVLMAVAVTSGALLHLLLRSLGPSGSDGRRRRRRGDRDREGGSPAEAYARLSRRLSVSGREFTEADYDLLLELDERDERLERFLHGAADEAIEALPVYVVKEGGGGRTCAVCMADLAVGESVRILPCMDQYHVGCIDVWLRQKAVCPVCKWQIS